VNVGGVLAALGVPDLHDRLGLVDARITDALSVGNGALAAATLRVAGSGGKRLRPALTVACAHLGDVFDERVVSGAAAVELVQVGSLIHDDIFEEASTRRGVPTINAVEGSKTALLAGDFVLACAGTEAARAGREQAVVLADTIVALCEGQVAECATSATSTVSSARMSLRSRESQQRCSRPLVASVDCARHCRNR
jgi:geranylgeranyl pyrophosphate synthase